jgi:hypothetical protein
MVEWSSPMRLTLLLLLVASLTYPAFADSQKAAECEAALSPPARQIYTATRGSNPTKATARGIVVSQVETMIKEGKMTLSEGRAAGKAAGKCLELLE